jgi:DNA-binding transcriptional LysR family regulator
MQPTENPLDAQLLRVFCILLAERSVTRTAARLNLSQPAISLALKRLREIFGDQLLVRSRDGMVPTERALALQQTAIKALEELDNLLLDPDKPDPASSLQTFTIALPDYVAPAYLAGAVREFRQRAPNARLVLRSLGGDFDFEGALAAGTIDIVIGNWPSPPAYLRTSTLFEDDVVCLVDRDHPFTKETPSQTEFLTASHIAPAPYSIAHRGVVETHLTKMRISRERRLVISYFAMAPYMLVGTDLVYMSSRHFASYFTTILPLAIVKPPLEFPRMRFYQLWHDRTQHSPMHHWLRQVLTRNRLPGDAAPGQ